jgi:amidase
VSRIELPGWNQAWQDASTILSVEAWRTNRNLVLTDPAGVGKGVLARLRAASRVSAPAQQAAGAGKRRWRRTLADRMTDKSVIVLPTLQELPPPLSVRSFDGTALTMPVNLAGLPALSMPVPTRGPIPAGMQLIGADRAEDLLVTVARLIERAVRNG